MNNPDDSHITEFEWDEGNSSKNWIKHGITVEEQEQAFSDEHKLVFEDAKHSKTEKRLLLFGKTSRGKAVIVAYTTRSGKIRCISARRMSRKERRMYEKAFETA